jgi:hypothetical protein
VIALIQVDDDHARIFLEQLLRFGGGAVALRAETQLVARAIPDERRNRTLYSEERRGNQESSSAISEVPDAKPVLAIKNNQEQSRAIKSHQEPSRAIESHQEPSRAIKRQQEPSRASKRRTGRQTSARR